MDASRDFWDILVIIAIISTGIVIAAAATMPFFVQRARYFREVEPRVTLESPSSSFNQSANAVSFQLELTNHLPNHLARLAVKPSTLRITGPTLDECRVTLDGSARGNLLPDSTHHIERPHILRFLSFDFNEVGMI